MGYRIMIGFQSTDPAPKTSNRTKLSEIPEGPFDLAQVLADELKHIKDVEVPTRSLTEVFAALDTQELTALCFSGGGIRSATFGLGIMEALAYNDLLEKFDYLSTVSGGGYLCSWLSAWIRR